LLVAGLAVRRLMPARPVPAAAGATRAGQVDLRTRAGAGLGVRGGTAGDELRDR
jgi:hypothetical protein